MDDDNLGPLSHSGIDIYSKKYLVLYDISTSSP